MKEFWKPKERKLKLEILSNNLSWKRTNERAPQNIFKWVLRMLNVDSLIGIKFVARQRIYIRISVRCVMEDRSTVDVYATVERKNMRMGILRKTDTLLWLSDSLITLRSIKNGSKNRFYDSENHSKLFRYEWGATEGKWQFSLWKVLWSHGTREELPSPLQIPHFALYCINEEVRTIKWNKSSCLFLHNMYCFMLFHNPSPFERGEFHSEEKEKKKLDQSH